MKRTPLGIDNYEVAYQYRYYVNKTNATVTLAELSKGTGLLFTCPRRFR